MIRPAFSTVACPEWTLQQVAQRAIEHGFEAVELRTFGDGSTRFACDPALTDENKTRRLFLERGVEILSLATSCRFDDAISPPVLGHVIADTERSIREAKRAIDLAVGLQCPFVRVFGFELPPRETRARGSARIARRLVAVLDHARNTGVRVVIENGGSFPRAADIAEMIDAVGSPLLGACYALSPAQAAGEQPADGVAALGPRLWTARIKDLRAGVPCPLGEGELACRELVGALHHARFDGPLVYEWDRAWLPDLAPADAVLPLASRALFGWIGELDRGSAPSGPGVARSPAAPSRVGTEPGLRISAGRR